MDKIEKKLLQVKKIRIGRIRFEIRKITMEDFLDKQGIPISKWQSETDFILNKQKEATLTLPELQKMWGKLFKKAIVSIDGDYQTDKYIDSIIQNYELSNDLYYKISLHCLGLKKKYL